MVTPDIREIGEALAVGESRRVQHCSPRRTALVTGCNTGFRVYCFRCGHSEFIKSSSLRKLKSVPSEPVHNQYNHMDIWNTSLEFYYNTSLWDIPALVWLASTGMTESLCIDYDVRYSTLERRILLPLHPHAYAFIGRAVHESQKPKYLVYGLKPCGVFDSRAFEVFNYNGIEEVLNSVVVVEDIISAIRVSQFMPSVALLGTYCGDGALDVLIKRNTKRVYLWLDGDAGGCKARTQVTARIEGMGIPVTQVLTDKDPKHFTNVEIQELLNG